MATTIKTLKEMKFKNGILLTGLPGIGLVGKIAVDYMLTQIKAEKFAEVYSDAFPPSVHTKNGIIELIKDEFYYFPYKNKDFIFLAGPVQPALDFRIASASEHYEFAKAIVDYIAERGITTVYTLAGINVGEQRVGLEPNIVCAATDERMLEEWKKVGAIADKPEGLITGAAGLILGLAAERGLRGACLMGETSSKLIYGDHAAAKKLLEILIKKFKFKLDMKKIKKEAKKIQQTFSQITKQLEAQQEEKQPEEPLSYVR